MHDKYTQYTYIYYVNKNIYFKSDLAINGLTALIWWETTNSKLNKNITISK